MTGTARIRIFISLLFIATFVLAACASATPTPSSADQEAAPAAQTGGKWCSGTNIIFFPGGAPGGPFETVVYNGAVQAAADLGPT